MCEEQHRKKAGVIFFFSSLSENAKLSLAFFSIQKCYFSQGGFNTTEMQTPQLTCNTTQIAKLGKQGRQLDKRSHVQRMYWNP